MAESSIKYNGWNYYSTITDNSTYSLPTNFSELLIEISLMLTNDSRNFTIVIPKRELSSSIKPFYVGEYYNSGNYAGAVVTISKTQWSYGGANYNGSSVGYQYSLYYR